MTRYKKELRKRGYKLEMDYPWLPYDCGSFTLEAVNTKIRNSYIVIIRDYNVGTSLEFIDRNYNVMDQDFI